MAKKILDACCGSKMMWFEKKHPEVLYADIRKGTFTSGHGDETVVEPDVICDFREMPFDNESFSLVVFDPPHSKWLGQNTVLGQKYGQLFSTWRHDLKTGFDECMRVLKHDGFLIFKWHDKDIKVSELLNVLGKKPLFGHPTGKHGKTIWMIFNKE